MWKKWRSKKINIIDAIDKIDGSDPSDHVLMQTLEVALAKLKDKIKENS